MYDNVKLAGSSQCLNTLAMLRDTPSLARHVQSLEIHPRLAPNHDEQGSEDTGSLARISALIVEVSSHMDALQTFVWGSSSGPSVSAMWTALRQQ